MKRIGWILIGVGIAVMALCVTFGILGSGRELVHGLTSTEYSTPVDRSLKLGEGKYVVFERDVVTIRPDQVHVIAPDGSTVTTHEVGSSQKIDRNGRTYLGAVSFHTPKSGHYRIHVDADQATQVLISRDLGSLILAVLGWILGAGLGFFILAAGVALLIVSAVRRRRPPVVTAAPPGWYSDPSTPGRQRWWNGQNWV